MHRIEGYSSAQIAERFEISVSAGREAHCAAPRVSRVDGGCGGNENEYRTPQSLPRSPPEIRCGKRQGSVGGPTARLHSDELAGRPPLNTWLAANPLHTRAFEG